MEISESRSNPFKIDANTIIVIIAVIGGTIAADNRYLDTHEAEVIYQTKKDSERFIRGAQDLHTQQTASLLELRARELHRLHSSTDDPLLRDDIQGEIDLTASKIAGLSQQFNKTYGAED